MSTGALQVTPPSTLLTTRIRDSPLWRSSAQARTTWPARDGSGSVAIELIGSPSSVGALLRVMLGAATTRENVAPPSCDRATTYEVVLLPLAYEKYRVLSLPRAGIWRGFLVAVSVV